MSKYQPKIQLMDVTKIKPYDKNAKIHTPNQIESLVKVIKTQGWDVPIVVDADGVIIKGHGRRLAALTMGLEKVPVIVRDDLTPEEVKAARLSDNRVAMGDFDVDAIKDELAELKSDGFDLTNMGFGEREIEMMLGELDTMDLGAFDEAPGASPEFSSTPGAPSTDEPQNASEPAKTAKAILMSDVLGFKHVPGEYKALLVEFQALAESASGKTGAEAFCELLKFAMAENTK